MTATSVERAIGDKLIDAMSASNREIFGSWIVVGARRNCNRAGRPA